jgi:hypothetical protein
MIDARKLFVHKQAIRLHNQEFFTGRQELLSRALDAIAVEGAALVIYGDAGIGKTSLAWQLLEVLRGNHQLLDRLSVTTQHPIDKYYCVWIQNNPGMVDLDALLLALLMKSAADDSFFSQFPDAFDEEIRDKIDRTYELNLAFLKAQAKFAPGSRESEPAEVQARALAERKTQVHFLFQDVLARIKKFYPELELVVMIDDFDRIPDRAGMGSLIKDTNDARFVVIGTGDNIVEIIADHRSSGRKLEGSKIGVPAFGADEINNIFDRAEGVYPGLLLFARDYRDLVIENSDGYPWLVQLLGYHSVLPRQKQVTPGNPLVLDARDFDYAADILASPLGDEDRYQELVTAVGDSPNREGILFSLCRAGQGWVTEEDVKGGLQGGAKRYFEHHLEHLEKAKIIKRNRDRIRFRDPILRSIVRLATKRGSLKRS